MSTVAKHDSESKKSLKPDRSSVILKTIQNNPGIHIRALMNLTKLENGVIVHYLDRLEKQGVVKSQKHARYRRYYSLDVTDSEYAIIRNLRKPTKKENSLSDFS
ncbi:hypothetical protein NMT12_60059 [metagenome]